MLLILGASWYLLGILLGSAKWQLEPADHRLNASLSISLHPTVWEPADLRFVRRRNRRSVGVVAAVVMLGSCNHSSRSTSKMH